MNNFNPLSLRDDVGALWENYVMAERLKCNLYLGRDTDSYFWRTYDQQKIDLSMDGGGDPRAVEAKWSAPSSASAPRGWRRACADSTYQVVHRENYLDSSPAEKLSGID